MKTHLLPFLKWRIPRPLRRKLLRLLRRAQRVGVRMLLTFITTRSFINSILGIRQTTSTNTYTAMTTTHNATSSENVSVIDAASRVAASLAAIPEEGFCSRREIKEIILHCSATKEGADFSAADIRRWHLQRGFNDIGYHFVVKLDGTVEPGRDINVTGAHCLNHNSRSIGVCYVGGLDRAGRPSDTRTPAQRLALPELIRRLRVHHPSATIHGHREFAAKACPCFNAAEYAAISPLSDSGSFPKSGPTASPRTDDQHREADKQERQVEELGLDIPLTKGHDPVEE